MRSKVALPLTSGYFISEEKKDYEDHNKSIAGEKKSRGKGSISIKYASPNKNWMAKIWPQVFA